MPHPEPATNMTVWSHQCVLGLCVGTVLLVQMGAAVYMLSTALPAFMGRKGDRDPNSEEDCFKVDPEN